MKPYLKKFLEDSGLTLDEADEFIQMEHKKRGLDKDPSPSDEFMNQLAGEARAWKIKMVENMSFDELRAECKRRGIL